MRINFLTSNVLHQVLDSEINVIYNGQNSVFDKLLFGLDINFFAFNNNDSYHDNCRNVTDFYIDMYDYDLYIDNDIISYKKNSGINRSLHVNSLIFQHNNKNKQLKKEDSAILNGQLSKIKKIFFNDNYAQSWNLDNSIVLDYGIPQDIFRPLDTINDKKDVLIYYGNNNILGQQVRDYLKADVLENLEAKSLDELNTMFNKYSVLVDLNNNLPLVLCALSAGCKAISLSDYTKIVPGLEIFTTPEDIIRSVPTIINKPLSYDQTSNYINLHHNYEIFQNKIYNIILNTAKREAYVA